MSSITPERKDLHIPYEERQEAKKAAGKLQNGENALSFDEKSKVWYAKPGADLDKVKKWLPENRIKERTPADPRDEFADALVSAGFEIDGLPAMDGKKHRVRVDGDKAGQKSGVYKAYLDGVPAGWYQNHREHSEPVKWVSSGQRMNADELTQLRLEAAQKLREREIQQQRKYDHNAQRVSLAHSLMPDATGNESYLANKGVKAFPGVKTDKQGRVVIPLQDADDNIRSLQRINDTGFKSLKKDAQKTGNYFVVGGELKNGEPVLYAEGYSTAASISEATKRPVVMTVDAGNLPKVAESLKARYPDSQHVILGDDDRYKETNKGREKATEAAEITGGIAHFPKFSNPREGLTDFNDLHKSEGLETVRMQVEEAIATNLNKVETMSEKSNDAPQRVKELSEPGAVITPKFEQEMDAYLSSRYEAVQEESDLSDYANYAAAQPTAIDAEPVAKPAPATVAIDAEPVTKPAPANVASDAESVENSIEPYREQEKALTADEDVKAWLSDRRVSTADLIASDNERENRHAASMNIEGAATPPESKKKSQQAEKHDDYFAEESHRPVMPERIAKAYTQIDDRYYFQGRPDSLAFVDKGEKLQTKISNAQVAGSLVEIAEARGWEEIQLKGTPDFKREAWLQATARGMTAHGYTPKEADLIRLKELSNKTKINEVSNAAEAHAVKAPVSDSAASKTQSVASAGRSVDLAKESGSVRQAATENVDSATRPAINPLEGTLKEHGKAPFEFKEGKKENYFVKLENADGKENVHWGLDLERAIEKAEVQPGDKVELARTGRKEVIVKEEIKDNEGKVIAVEEKATHRNTWEVKADALRDKERPAAEVVREHPDLVNEIATVKLAEKFSQGMDSKSRAAFMDGVREKLANDVQQGRQAPEVKIKEERNSSQTKTASKEPEIER